MDWKTRLHLLGVATLLTFSSGSQAQTVLGSPLEVVARISYPDFSGVAVMPGGRIFLGFPRHADDHSGPTLAEYRQADTFPRCGHEPTRQKEPR
jgi:hypothetical protein